MTYDKNVYSCEGGNNRTGKCFALVIIFTGITAKSSIAFESLPIRLLIVRRKKVQPICELSLYEIMIVKPRSSHALKSRLILCINPATERVKLLLMQQTKIQKICIYDRFSLRNLNKPNPKV